MVVYAEFEHFSHILTIYTLGFWVKLTDRDIYNTHRKAIVNSTLHLYNLPDRYHFRRFYTHYLSGINH